MSALVQPLVQNEHELLPLIQLFRWHEELVYKSWPLIVVNHPVGPQFPPNLLRHNEVDEAMLSIDTLIETALRL